VPLLIVNPGSTETKKEISVSHCPLNFSETDSLPPMAEWLDLGRLNTLQSLASQRASEEARRALHTIPIDKNSRVAMSDVRRLLVTLACERTEEESHRACDTER
jgi:hypothetical protein